MKRVVVLTGAGISAESGLQTFRGADGLWEGHRVEDVATPEAWAANPALVLDFYNQRRRAVRAPRPIATLVRAGLFAVTLVTALAASAVAVERSPQELFDQAVQLFFDAKPVESARLFDQLVEAVPAAEPELWQRGLALYYADRFADGRAQFELHRTVNPNDVENPAWHFLCVTKLEGMEAARPKLLPVGEDARVPMKEILALFSGRGDEAAVIQAAEQGEGEARKNQLCYAHLYLGLFHEAAGNTDKAREHITQAAGPFKMNHYMGKVAVMHAKLRGWEKAAVQSGNP